MPCRKLLQAALGTLVGTAVLNLETVVKLEHVERLARGNHALRLAFPGVRNLPENPRVVHGAAPDGHTGHAIIFNPLAGDLHAVYVAVPDYGNLRGSGDLPYPVPVGEAVIALQAGAAVHREHFNALALGNPEGFQHVDALAIPADAALERKGHLHPAAVQRGTHVVQYLLQAGQIPQKARSAALASHLRRRTARIHLDVVGPERHGNLPGGIRHLVGETPENLHPEGPFFGEKPELLVAVQVEHGIAVRRHELRNQEPHAVPGEHPAQPAEGRIRHPVHRAEDGIREHFQPPEAKRNFCWFLSHFQTFNICQHLNHNYPHIVRNESPKKIFNFHLVYPLTLC